jgi:hypothetical protein
MKKAELKAEVARLRTELKHEGQSLLQTTVKMADLLNETKELRTSNANLRGQAVALTERSMRLEGEVERLRKEKAEGAPIGEAPAGEAPAGEDAMGWEVKRAGVGEFHVSAEKPSNEVKAPEEAALHTFNRLMKSSTYGKGKFKHYVVKGPAGYLALNPDRRNHLPKWIWVFKHTFGMRFLNLKDAEAHALAQRDALNADVKVVKIFWGRKADSVNHPSHYTSHPSGIECIQVTEHMSFCVGNAVKYLWRADLKKNPLEDLQKAKWYIEREIQKRSKKP